MPTEATLNCYFLLESIITIWQAHDVTTILQKYNVICKSSKKTGKFLYSAELIQYLLSSQTRRLGTLT